jgi:hypothetical protein
MSDENTTNNGGGWQTVGKDKKSELAVHKLLVSAEQDKAARTANLAREKPKHMDGLFKEWSKTIGYVTGTVYKSDIAQGTDAEEPEVPRKTFSKVISSALSTAAPKQITDIDANGIKNANNEPEVSYGPNVKTKSASSSTPAPSEVERESLASSTVTSITDEEGFTPVSTKNAGVSIAKENASVQEDLPSTDNIEQVEEPTKKKKKRGKKGGRKVNKNKAQSADNTQDGTSSTDAVASKQSEDAPAASLPATTESSEVVPETIDEPVDVVYTESHDPVNVQINPDLTETKAKSTKDLLASSLSPSSTGKAKPVDFFPFVPSPAPFTSAKPAQKTSNIKRGKKFDDTKTTKRTNIFNALPSEDDSDFKALTMPDSKPLGAEEEVADDTEILPQKKNKKRGKKGGKAVQQKARREAQAAADAAFNKGVPSTAAMFVLAVLIAGFGAFLKS